MAGEKRRVESREEFVERVGGNVPFGPETMAKLTRLFEAPLPPKVDREGRAS